MAHLPARRLRDPHPPAADLRRGTRGRGRTAAGQAGTSRRRKVIIAAARSAAATISRPVSDARSTSSAGTFGVQPNGDSFSAHPGSPSNGPNMPARTAHTTRSHARPAHRGAKPTSRGSDPGDDQHGRQVHQGGGHVAADHAGVPADSGGRHTVPDARGQQENGGPGRRHGHARGQQPATVHRGGEQQLHPAGDLLDRSRSTEATANAAAASPNSSLVPAVNESATLVPQMANIFASRAFCFTMEMTESVSDPNVAPSRNSATVQPITDPRCSRANSAVGPTRWADAVAGPRPGATHPGTDVAVPADPVGGEDEPAGRGHREQQRRPPQVDERSGLLGPGDR